MARLTDLPNIPADALRAHEDGRLILFCGAGISMPSGLPSFATLAADVAARHGTPGPGEDAALQSGEYDRFLHLVENRVGPASLRIPIARSLKSASPAPLHEWLIDLAKGRDGKFRIVTTNFDTLLEQAAAIKGVVPAIETGPRLGPMHPTEWNSLVHLHGVIGQAHDPNGREMVLTSGDFGRAYLSERWASKFTADLFSNFSVLFIGYSANDPVMRYLLDAFAARGREPTPGRPHPQFYALVQYKLSLSKVEREWASKGVRIIPYQYNGRGKSHPRLNARLERWAKAFRGGQSSKTYAARRILDAGPSNLVDETESELAWILSDDSGVPVRHALIDPDGHAKGHASPSWLGSFEKLAIPSGGLALGQAYGVSGDWSKGLPPRFSPLVSSGSQIRVPLEPRALALAAWLAEMAVTEEPRPGDGATPSASVLRRIITMGGALVPELLQMIRARLLAKPLGDSALHAAWQLATNPGINAALQPSRDLLDVPIEQLAEEEWSSDCIESLIQCLSPLVHLDLPFTSATGRPIDISVEPRCGDEIDLLVEALEKTPNQDEKFAMIAPSMSATLENTLRLLSAHASGFAHTEPIQYPRVSSLASDRYFAWTVIPDIAASCSAAQSRVDLKRARATFEWWVTSEHTTMRRLAVHAAGTWSGLSAGERMRAFTND